MTAGERVAKRYKKQYCKRNVWKEMEDWDLQPEQIHLILLELKTKAAIDALMGNGSWTKRLSSSRESK